MPVRTYYSEKNTVCSSVKGQGDIGHRWCNLLTHSLNCSFTHCWLIHRIHCFRITLVPPQSHWLFNMGPKCCNYWLASNKRPALPLQLHEVGFKARHVISRLVRDIRQNFPHTIHREFRWKPNFILFYFSNVSIGLQFS